MSEILENANHASASTRARALAAFAKLDDDAQRTLFAALLKSEFKDVREGVLDVLSADKIHADPSWIDAVAALTDSDPDAEWLLCIGVLALLARFDQKLPANCLVFGENCLKAQNDDLRYQAACFLEMQEDSSEDYVTAITGLLNSRDEDLRIVAVQALSRLKPTGCAQKLAEHARHALGLEGFHVLLARLEVGSDDERRQLEPELIRQLVDDRFCYPAIVALKKYGSKLAIEPLLRIASSFLGEPTLRISAAEAAAQLGSQEGIVWLNKFAKHSANREYAQLALASIENRQN